MQIYDILGYPAAPPPCFARCPPVRRSLIMQKRVAINVLKTSRLVNLFGRIMPESRKAGVFASESDIAYAISAVSSRGMGTTLRAGPFHRQTTGGPGNHPSPSSAAGHWWPHGGRSAASPFRPWQINVCKSIDKAGKVLPFSAHRDFSVGTNYKQKSDLRIYSG